ncbi:hypothetical protein [Helicobacter felis]|uniref:hypothetical protein n=1 Tax=Helicobacter felis TaxID=214 RepID=UPI000CF1BF15|nr:hypothetical protein [Helicobacter felis]
MNEQGRMQIEIRKLKCEIEEANQEREAFQHALTKYQEYLDALQNERNQLTCELEDRAMCLDKIRREQQVLEAELSTLKTQNAQLQEENEALLSENIQEIQHKNMKLTSKYETLTKENTELRQENAQLEKQVIELQGEVSRLKESTTGFAKEILTVLQKRMAEQTLKSLLTRESGKIGRDETAKELS